MSTKLRRIKGQGLVEFALILPALLAIIFAIIEGAFLFQAYLAVQHAAREAARYAVTYQPPQTFSVQQGHDILQGLVVTNPAFPGETKDQWYQRRVDLIRDRALEQSMGIRVNHQAVGNYEKSPVDFNWVQNSHRAGFFGVRVRGLPTQTDPPEFDHPGLPGLTVEVEVVYCWAPLDPIVAFFLEISGEECVPVTGRAAMINEGVQVGMGAAAPPTFPPPPTIPGATPTPTGDWTPGPTETPTEAVTPTMTPTPVTPTPTPNVPYIVLVPEQERWLIEEWNTDPGETPAINVELYNHPQGPQYRFFWNDGCGGPDVDLGYSRQTDASGYAVEPVHSRYSIYLDPGVPYYGNYDSGTFSYLSNLCGDPLPEGQTFTATIKTKKLDGASYVDVASTSVPIYVPYKRPNLKIMDIILPADLAGGGEIRVGVVISNTENVSVEDPYDIDIYINPQHEPLPGLPGLGTAGVADSPPKQWDIDGVNRLGTEIVWYVITLPGTGEFDIWAQVDTSDLIDEKDDLDNIYGPQVVDYPCSEYCDDFDLGNNDPPDPKWDAVHPVGTDCSGEASAYILGEGLIIQGTGCSVFNDNDGRFFFFHQGAYNDNFDMRVQLLQRPDRTWAKAGLTVRESLDTRARYIAIGVSKNDSGNYNYQVWDRLNNSGSPVEYTECRATIPSNRFEGTDPPGVWLRIVKEGNTFTKYTSLDGETWVTDPSCMTTTFDNDFSANYPGILMAPY